MKIIRISTQAGFVAAIKKSLRSRSRTRAYSFSKTFWNLKNFVLMTILIQKSWADFKFLNVKMKKSTIFKL